MDVVAHNPDFDDSGAMPAGNFRKRPAEERRHRLMDERQATQRRPCEQTIEPHRHGPQNRI
jgi:hypothetical protein